MSTAGGTGFCNTFENFQTKKLKRRVGKPGEWCFRNQRQSFYNNQWVTSLDGIQKVK